MVSPLPDPPDRDTETEPRWHDPLQRMAPAGADSLGLRIVRILARRLGARARVDAPGSTAYSLAPEPAAPSANGSSRVSQPASESPAFDVVAVAASAGGLPAISQILASLPADFPATILVVQHLDPRHRSLMAHILARRTVLRVREAEEGDRLAAGTVLIAPPDRHLLLNPDGSVSLSQSEMVHFLRPSADLLFESVAASRRKRAIALVLSGSGSDGAMGVRAIRKTGGTVIIQDQKTAQFFGMPWAAIQTGTADLVLPLEEIAGALRSLCAGTGRGVPDERGEKEMP